MTTSAHDKKTVSQSTDSFSKSTAVTHKQMETNGYVHVLSSVAADALVQLCQGSELLMLKSF